MKIFAAADLHGDRNQMELLLQAAKEADLLLICGDVGGREFSGGEEDFDGSMTHRIFRSFPKEQAEDAKYLDSILSQIGIPTYYILGNDDWFESSSPFHLTDPTEVGGYTLLHFEWVGLTPFRTNREANENKLMYELCKLPVQDADKTIIVGHAPPKGCGDTIWSGQPCGSRSIREWIVDVQPKLWLCGHIHEDFCHGYIGATLVCNCATHPAGSGKLRGWLIDTNAGAQERQFGPEAKPPLFT